MYNIIINIIQESNNDNKKKIILSLLNDDNSKLHNFLLNLIKLNNPQNILFNFTQNILHLVIFNKLDIDLLLYDLLLCYYLYDHSFQYINKYLTVVNCNNYTFDKINLNFTYDYENIFLCTNYDDKNYDNIYDKLEKLEYDLSIEKSLNSYLLIKIEEIEEKLNTIMLTIN